MPEEGKLTAFVDARRWLTKHLRHEEGLSIEVGPDAASVVVSGDRTTVAVVEAGGVLPETYDVLVVMGSVAQLAEAADRLADDQMNRVQLVPLPCPPILLNQALHSALAAAETLARARMADQLLDIGVALNAERDPVKVLELILLHAREITGADAGSIYLLEQDNTLRFRIAHNDSVDAPLEQFTMPVSPSSIVGAAVINKTTLRIRDLYDPSGSIAVGRHFTHDRSFDTRFGYQTRSMITTPMISPDGKVLAVIQLINAKNGHGPLHGPISFQTRVRAFSAEDERLCTSLASQAAVALESARLHAEIQDLFEGFVRASVHAIEQRDPTTSGHSQRVADLTVALARTADGASDERFGPVKFTRDELTEIEYAGLLHDFGKVGVREEVLVKAKKLYPHQLEMVRGRFGHARTTLQLELMTARLEALREGKSVEATELQINARIAEFDDMLKVILAANEPSLLATEASEKLRGVAEAEYLDDFGESQRLLHKDELDALLIARGTLTTAERLEIQSHVTHTYNFLVRIPWGHTLRRIPEIAGKHHEYLDGSGYPEAMPSTAIPLQARMMTVADIFDALTASDRPYKKAVPIPKALAILGSEVKNGKVDSEVFDLFVGAKVWESALGVA